MQLGKNLKDKFVRVTTFEINTMFGTITLETIMVSIAIALTIASIFVPFVSSTVPLKDKCPEANMSTEYCMTIIALVIMTILFGFAVLFPTIAMTLVPLKSISRFLSSSTVMYIILLAFSGAYFGLQADENSVNYENPENSVGAALSLAALILFVLAAFVKIVMLSYFSGKGKGK